MNIDFPQELGSAGDAVFASLRAKLAGEVESSAMLADLLQKLNGMQEAQARPADFKERFDVFVARAEEYLEVVRPFIPALVQFLPAHMGSFGDREVPGTESAGLNRHIIRDARALQERKSDSILTSSLALESLSRGVRGRPSKLLSTSHKVSDPSLTSAPFLEGETMRFKWLDSKALILKSRKELITSLVAAAVVTAAGFAIGSASLASAQDISRRASAAEAAFLTENDAAMTKMMNDMDGKPTGDVDHDFVAMMAPHHQGAIDMSEAELRYGHNEQLIRIAQDIVVEELQEIAAMRAASGEKLTPTEATLAASFAGTAAGPGFSSPVPADNVPPSLKTERPFLAENAAAMTKMMNDMTIKPTANIDRDFVAMMVPHHQGAIDMAQAELRYGREAQLRRIAQEIIVDQIQQISLMRLAVGEPLPPSVSSPTDPLPQSRAGRGSAATSTAQGGGF